MYFDFKSSFLYTWKCLGTPWGHTYVSLVWPLSKRNFYEETEVQLIVKFCLIFNLWCLKEKLHLHDFLSYLHHQKSDQNDALFLYILPIKGIYLLKGQEGQLTYSISTLLDNLKLYPKIQFSKKIQYCQLEFWANKQWYWEIFKCQIYLDNLNFRAKIVICVRTELTITETTIFGVKIQNLIEMNVS